MELRNFKIEEFKCPCCGEVHMDEEFLKTLDAARSVAGTPFKITSGYRCAKHNAKVGGVSESAHTTGYASDISCTGSRERFLIIQGLMKAGVTRIGIAKTFIHADMDPSKDEYVIWLYS